VKGRKRHILVDTNGWLMHVRVHEADLQDHDGGKRLLAPLKPRFPRLKRIWAASADKNGDFVEWENRAIGLGSGGGGASLERPARRLGLQRGGH
jgi:putative transposase